MDVDEEMTLFTYIHTIGNKKRDSNKFELENHPGEELQTRGTTRNSNYKFISFVKCF